MQVTFADCQATDILAAHGRHWIAPIGVAAHDLEMRKFRVAWRLTIMSFVTCANLRLRSVRKITDRFTRVLSVVSYACRQKVVFAPHFSSTKKLNYGRISKRIAYIELENFFRHGIHGNKHVLHREHHHQLAYLVAELACLVAELQQRQRRS